MERKKTTTEREVRQTVQQVRVSQRNSKTILETPYRQNRIKRRDKVRKIMQIKKSSNLFLSQKQQILPLLLAFAHAITSLNTLLDLHIAGSLSSILLSRLEYHFLSNNFLNSSVQNPDFKNERPIHIALHLYMQLHVHKIM